ncbi:glycosyltransferase family 4 protein [Cyanobacterium aponinum AL20118]|uniref:Glycosyltransferase family 4 protein n=1 Tax=Cyanobacterium aponinum AL20115 TaxID=3090662 RepID=A0AAF0ZDP2_9CHRO|nr:glycosyltransferase family 4 protein [Cyanobacterium aponinum]PHV63385.1 glycosyltransferase WbuB [Cyanobacterium aponinum IPPAS B-1201]WPF88355.1 glycosyltransferase family 4 protein [Cyanobacterium aponinum AL20115]
MGYPQSKDLFRVLIFNQFYPPDYAATGQFIEELATEVSREDVKIRVFSGQPGYATDIQKAPRNEKKGRLNIRRSRVTNLLPQGVLAKVGNSTLFFMRAFLHTLRHQKKEDLLIVTTAPAFMTWLGYLAHLMWKKKYICLIYDLYPNVVTALGILPERHPIIVLWQKLNQKTWQFAEEIIVLSQPMKSLIADIYPPCEHKITVIDNWADGDFIKPIKKEDNWFAQKYGLDKKFTILYSGNMGRCHDMETIVNAACLLKEYQDQIQFVFIGGGSKQKWGQEKINQVGLQNFLFLPYQKREVLPYSLTACDVSLISMGENMAGVVAPSKLYSTLAAGKAVVTICPKNSFLNELMTTANCGKSFRNGESEALASFLLDLSNNEQLCQEMGHNARRYFCDYFTKKTAIAKYLQVIDKVRFSEQKVFS